MSDGYFVHQFRLGPWDNFIYFIGCKKTREVAVVDPAWHGQSILQEAEKIDVKIKHVLCTHSHFDHVDQVPAIVEACDVPVHMMGEEIDFSGFKSENLKRHSPGDDLVIGEHAAIKFMHTPGHTPGSTTYALKDGILTGDTLFVEGCGRCDFVGGDPEVMHATLHKMTSDLPGETRVYPGHDYGETPSSTLDHELKANPFLLQPTLGDFVKHRMKDRTPNTLLPPKPDWSPDNT